MADSVYGRLLARAIEIQGSAQSVAEMLRVPEATMLRWLVGSAFMPLQAFNRLMSYVADAEARDISSASTAQQQRGGDAAERLTFPVAKLFARCAGCEGVEFHRAVPEAPLRMNSILVCCACGMEVLHKGLLARLGEDVIAHRRAGTLARAGRRDLLTAKRKSASPTKLETDQQN